MADSNHNRRADFLDDDPFAELTRIMGHDPRASRGQAEPQPTAEVVAFPEVGDDFGVDLEKELMGELDLAGFDQPETDAGFEADAPEAVAPEADWRAAEAFAAPAAAPVTTHAAPERAFEDEDFGSALERELFSAEDEPPLADTAAPVATEGRYEDSGLDLSFLEEEIARDAAPAAESAPEPAFVPEHAFAPDPEPQWDIEPAAEGATFDDAPVAVAAAPSSHEDDAWEPVEPAAQDVQQPVAEPVFSAFVPAAAPSLEDELNALLAAGGTSAAAPAARQDGWRPLVETFGRANFAAPRATATWEQPAAAEVDHYAPHIDTVEDLPEPAAAAGDEFADIFGDDFALEVEEQPQDEQPEAWPAAAAVAAAGVAASAQWLPRSDEFAAPAPTPAYAPEVETVDVAEAAPAVVDDLDIPELDYASPEPRAFDPIDDIEAEFVQAFGDLSSSGQPDPGHAATATAAAPDQFSADAYALGEDEWQTAARPADDDFDYESDLEHAVAMSAYEDAAAQKPASGRRGLLVAALVGGVALIGGLGVFGMSFFGGETDGPAIVRADTEPMKVRPENPGGTTVPNQDSQAYARVGGGQQEAAPGQERLITTAEEPVDVAAQTQPPALAPGIDDEDLFAQEGAEAEGALKSEERIDPAETAPATVAAEEVAAVAPRRVRTMIVRPDGTLVPREETEPATAEPASEPAADVLAAAPLAAAPTLGPANTLQPAQAEQAAAAGEEEGGPLVETPPTVAVVPSRRVEPQAEAAPRPAAPQPAPQQPAATAVSAPAAAAPAAGGVSEWSMQIASQPTAEGAQATYQDLARRYGGVLEGRGVNIVRADIEGMGTYYRVRIPASSRDEAIQLCTRYKAAGGSCFVSR